MGYRILWLVSKRDRGAHTAHAYRALGGPLISACGRPAPYTTADALATSTYCQRCLSLTESEHA